MKDLIQKELEKRKYEICKEQKPYSFKQVFYPSEEKILKFEGKKIKEKFDSNKRAIFDARFHDLKALALYDEVF
ncbi:MAG: hypothetical protein U9O91_02360, partial [Candidatus Caldatribacteriota bacterium]|nr:hypothetical protein [Candidatus Caldatribacteriota bacterium]